MTLADPDTDPYMLVAMYLNTFLLNAPVPAMLIE